MRKNNLLLFLIPFVAIGCSRSNAPKTLITKWEKNYEGPKFLERKLAATGSEGQCLKDVYGLDLLKAQVAELERNYASGEKITGTWKHLNLADLPVPQASFLKKYGTQIGDLTNPDRFDYSSCKDLPCVFNKIHGKGDHTAGYVHYLWYLRMGQMLSLDNMVPDQASPTAGIFNGKQIPFESYLYSDDELYAFWRLSLMMKTPHSNLVHLKEVQRVPKGESYEKPDYKGACGLASSVGWITLQDGCLWLYKNLDTGYFYTAVTHELTHQVDFHQGRGSQKFYRSHRDDYLALIGMTVNEYVNESNVLIRQWQVDPKGKYITNYAKTNPQENFAESIAYFRVDGDRTNREMSSEQYKFVSENYFQNRKFEKVELLKGMLNTYSSEVSKSIFQAVVDCSKEQVSPRSVYFSGSDFTNPVLPQMLNCIGSRAQEMSLTLRAKIAINEPDGCSSLNEFPGKAQWDGLVKENLRVSFDRYLQDLYKDKDYLARIEAFYAELKDKTIARNAYINCYGSSSEEGCFNREIKKLALEKAQNLKLPPDQTEEMANMYISYHSYRVIKEETSDLYKTFVGSHLQKIQTASEDLWEGCTAGSQDDEAAPRAGQFQIGDGYMISSMYNCLNSGYPDTLRNVLRELSVDNMKIEHPNEELILMQLIKPELNNSLMSFYNEEKAKEMTLATEIIAKDDGSYRQKVLSDFSWVKNVSDNNQITSDCKRAVYSLIDHPGYFNLKKDLFSDFAEQRVCVGLQETSQFKDWLSSSEVFLTEKIVNELEEKLLVRGQARATACLRQYPMNSALNKIRYKKQREDCFMNGWTFMEEQILKEAVEDPIVIKFKIPQETLRGKIELNRRRIQVKIMKERLT